VSLVPRGGSDCPDAVVENRGLKTTEVHGSGTVHSKREAQADAANRATREREREREREKHVAGPGTKELPP
jgi:hypothetical protein